MPGFFDDRTVKDNVMDAVTGGLGGVKLGLTTGVLMSAYGSGGLALGTLFPLAGFCALSGAALIIPAFFVLSKLVSAMGKDPSPVSVFLMCGLIKAVLHAGIVSIAAGLLGLAIVPVLKAAMIASVILTVVNGLSLVLATQDRGEDEDDKGLGAMVAVMSPVF